MFMLSCGIRRGPVGSGERCWERAGAWLYLGNPFELSDAQSLTCSSRHLEIPNLNYPQFSYEGYHSLSRTFLLGGSGSGFSVLTSVRDST